ncbi:MAG TPA: hypothetical protein PLS84_06000 [Salinivirgaceae bacterium]|nr:hypothetical protein [Salinivirgaceae bacterium]
MKRPLNNKNLKQNIFKVPHGYFETLADKTFANVGIEVNSDVTKKPTKRYILTAWSSVAAAAIVVAFVLWYIASEINAINIEEKYYTAVDNSILGFSTNTLTSFIDFENDEPSNGLTTYMIDDISTVELIDYSADNY